MGIKQEINAAVNSLCKEAQLWGYYAPAHDPQAARDAATPQAMHANLNMYKGMATGLRDLIPETAGGIGGFMAGTINAIKKFPDTFSFRRIPDNFNEGTAFVHNNFTQPAINLISRFTKPLSRIYNAENSRLENKIMQDAGDAIKEDPKDPAKLMVNNAHIHALRTIAENRAGSTLFHSAVTSIPWLFMPGKKIPTGILPYAASTWLPWSQEGYYDRHRLRQLDKEYKTNVEELNNGIEKSLKEYDKSHNAN